MGRFTKACEDNTSSQVMAFYMLQTVTKCEPRREIMAVMPTSSSGGAGVVTSYSELIEWLWRAEFGHINKHEGPVIAVILNAGAASGTKPA